MLEATQEYCLQTLQTLVSIYCGHGWWVGRTKTGQVGQVRFNSYALYLSWEIHSKSFMLVTFSSISFAATSLAWTSITIRADNTARCILDNFPRTRATKSPSCVRKRKYSEANHVPKTQAVLTQCSQTYGILRPDHTLCPGNFCLFSCQRYKWLLRKQIPLRAGSELTFAYAITICSGEKKELEPPWGPELRTPYFPGIRCD